jgi:hypothetical protein
MMEIQALASDRNKQKHGEVKTGQYDSFVPPILIGSPWKYRYKKYCKLCRFTPTQKQPKKIP